MMSAYLSERRRLQAGDSSNIAMTKAAAAEARHQAAEADAWAERRKGRVGRG